MNRTMIEAALKKLHRQCKANADRAEREYEEGGFKAAMNGDEQVVELRGVFDGGWWGVDAAAVIAGLSDKAKTIRVIIDSPGGFVDEGRSLYSEFRARADKGQAIITEGRGLVASAAVLPLLAGDERTMEESTLVMVHNPWGFLFSVGDADEIRDDAAKMVKQLETYTKSYAKVVAERTGMTQKAATEALKAETWYDSDDAIDNGFVSGLASAPDVDDPAVVDATAKTREKMAAAALQMKRTLG